VSRDGTAVRLRGARGTAGGALVIAIVAALTLVFAASAYAGSCECVKKVEPNSGPKAGGTTVTILVQTPSAAGTVTAVKFGSEPATISQVEPLGTQDLTRVTAISPPGEGTVDVIATVVEGQSTQDTRPQCETEPGGSCDHFSYLPGDEPTVTQVEPDFGPLRGGTAVRISGNSLPVVTAVMFGSTPAASFRVRPDGSIIAHSPPGTGTVDITVTAPGGTSPTGLADLFSYATPGEWAIFPTPSLGSEGSLNGASCASRRFCVAVGHDGTPGGEGLIEAWNGRAWVVAAAPPTPEGSAVGGIFSATVTAGFNGVSCTSPAFCAAVGTFQVRVNSDPDSSGHGVLLANWNGATWTAAPDTGKFPGEGDHVGGFGRPELNGVSCVSPSSCVAVGVQGASGIPNGPLGALVESWNGEIWSPVPSPETLHFVALQGVSCTSTAFCVAVGTDGLIESWNGTAWSIVPSPSSGTLNGVWCASAKRCLAVGANEGAALIESWDGSTWSIVNSPKPEASALKSITCVSKIRCVAVGSDTVGGAARTLVETLLGSRWSMDRVSDSTALNGVSCTADWSCFAVGYDEAGPAGPSQTLVLDGGLF
jgi:IPT/TIG domain